MCIKILLFFHQLNIINKLMGTLKKLKPQLVRIVQTLSTKWSATILEECTFLKIKQKLKK